MSWKAWILLLFKKATTTTQLRPVRDEPERWTNNTFQGVQQQLMKKAKRELLQEMPGLDWRDMLIA